MDGQTLVLTDEGSKPIAGYPCPNAVGETKAHPCPPYSHHLILNTSLPRVWDKGLWRMCAMSFKCNNWALLAWSWDQGLREIGASAALKVCRAYSLCSEKTPVLLQHEAKRFQELSQKFVRWSCHARVGQSQWWEALWSSPKDTLQLHLQSSHPQSWPAVFRQNRWSCGSLTEQNNLEILQWMKRLCVRDLVTALLFLWRKTTFL